MNRRDRILSVDSTQPARDSEKPAEAVQSTPVSFAPLGSTDPLEILLVDDNAFVRRAGLCLLEGIGHRVETVADGLSAVDRCASRHYDLILMDLEMPGIDGYEASRRIRQLQGHRDRLGIIALATRGSTLDDRKALSAGMEETLAKPLLESEVRRLIPEVRCPIHPPTVRPRNVWTLSPETIRVLFPMSQTAMSVVVALFRESCHEKLGRIRAALAEHDRIEFARNTHALKGSLGMFASPMTVEIVTHLEDQVEQNDASQIHELLEILQHAIQSLQPTLDELTSESPNGCESHGAMKNANSDIAQADSRVLA